MKLRDLAAKSGFSRAALSRQSIKHTNRGRIAAHHATAFNPDRGMVFEDGTTCTLQGLPYFYEGPAPTTPDFENDFFIVIHRAPAVEPRHKPIPQEETEEKYAVLDTPEKQPPSLRLRDRPASSRRRSLAQNHCRLAQTSKRGIKAIGAPQSASNESPFVRANHVVVNQMVSKVIHI